MTNSFLSLWVMTKLAFSFSPGVKSRLRAIRAEWTWGAWTCRRIAHAAHIDPILHPTSVLCIEGKFRFTLELLQPPNIWVNLLFVDCASFHLLRRLKRKPIFEVLDLLLRGQIVASSVVRILKLTQFAFHLTDTRLFEVHSWTAIVDEKNWVYHLCFILLPQ